MNYAEYDGFDCLGGSSRVDGLDCADRVEGLDGAGRVDGFDCSDFAPLREDMMVRAQMYSLLSRLFIWDVDEELLALLKEERPLVSEDERLSAAVDRIQAYLVDEGCSVLDLARDYAKAFCGASSTQKTSAFPFESVYTSERGLLMQEARDDMLKWYRAYHLEKSESFHDCEDHLGLELEFYAFLINEFLVALDDGDAARAQRVLQDQHVFMHEHLINWIPEFTHHVTMRARTEFYQGLGQLLLAYVRIDCTFIDELVEGMHHEQC